MYLIGVDIGGSHVGMGLIDADSLVMRDSVTTKINGNDILAAELVQVVVDGCHSLLKRANITVENIHVEIEAVGMGCPGQVHNNVLITAVNFPKLADCPLAQLVCKALGGKVFTKLINDADAAMCAEIWGNPAVYGKYQHIAMVTLGTGVGFGLILNGQLHQGASGLIEGGHMIVTSNSTENAFSLSSKPKTPSSASTSSSNIASTMGGLAHARLCGCGQVGCVETVASAKNTVQRLIDADAQESQSQQSSPQVDGKVLFERYAMNDFNAVKVVEETGEYLALMVINVCRVVDPEIIVFGGGLSKAGKPLLDVIKKHVKQRTWKLPTDVKLTLALTDENGVIGAALAAKNDASRVLATPSAAATSASDVTHPVDQKEAHPHQQSPSLQPPQSSRKTASSSSSSSSRAHNSTGTHLPLWVGAFVAMSSTALFALDVFGINKGDKGSSGSAGVVAWVTRGLLAGQMAVGAYVLQQTFLSQSQVQDN